MSEEQKNQSNRDQIAEESRALEEADAKAVAAAREKKRLRRKKARRRKLIFCFILILIVGSVILIWQYQKKKAEAEKNAVLEVTAEEGQEIVYGQITEIFGNEMTVEILEKVENEAPSEDRDSQKESRNAENPVKVERVDATPKSEETSKEATSDTSNDTEKQRPERPSGAEAPSGFSGPPSGDMPSGFSGPPSGDIPSGFSGSPSGDMPSGFPDASGAEVPFGPQGSQMSFGERYKQTGESKEIQIPVGTDVITKLGSVTTFSRLGSSDRIAMIMDEENLVKIYILNS